MAINIVIEKICLTQEPYNFLGVPQDKPPLPSFVAVGTVVVDHLIKVSCDTKTRSPSKEVTILPSLVISIVVVEVKWF